jgi:lipoprotein-anchoring transpeptidase ErfK/SrfK
MRHALTAGLARHALACAVLAVALSLLSAASAGAVAPSQPVTTLYTAHAIYAAPGGHREATISARRPITGEETTLPVLATRAGAGGTWLHVRLPGRLLPGAANGRTGWITAAHTRLWSISWHIVVSLRQRRARIYRSGRLVRSYLVVVGKPSTPTPAGQFFVEENIAEPPSFAGAPYALATSARSNVFTEFDGGPGQVALHGMGGGLGGTPGTAESHGCVRFTAAAITWLAARIYPGTPVTITP